MKRGDHVTFDGRPATVAAVTKTHVDLDMDDGSEVAVRALDAIHRIQQQGTLPGLLAGEEDFEDVPARVIVR